MRGRRRVLIQPASLTTLLALATALLALGPRALRDDSRQTFPHPRTALASLRAAATAKPEIVADYGKLPLSFEVNRGQVDPQVKFVSRGRGYSLFLTSTEAVLQLRVPTQPGQVADSGLRNEDQRYFRRSGSNAHSTFRNPHSAAVSAVSLRLRLVGANRSPRIRGLGELPGKSNYFIGNDPSKWRTDVPSYTKVEYRDVYPGVNLVYYGNGRQLEHDFVVAPGADPSVIRFAVEGADKMELDAQGDLLLHVGNGDVRLREPVVYQDVHGTRQKIPGGYVLHSSDPQSEIGNRQLAEVGFQVAAYDATRPLVVDPVLVYSTYLGGSGGDGGSGIAVDSAGNAYVTGYTYSADFPTASPLQARTGAGQDVFVTKLNAAGSALVYSTYLGGTGEDAGAGMAVDAAGNAHVTGYTSSTNFPTASPFQAVCGGGPYGCSDAFVAKLNPSGSALIYSTYLGGSGADSGSGIAVDAAGSAYVTGWTSSTNFPTANAQQASNKGGSDVFVTKLNGTGSALVYSTYLGGTGEDYGAGIAVDSAGNAYLVGNTYSTNFPTANPLQALLGGGDYDVFVAKLNAAGSALVYSTYLGGSGTDSGSGIAVDSGGNAYVTGGTSSTNFPTASPLQASYTAAACNLGGNFRPCNDAFVTKVNPAGSALVYSTYLGGSVDDVGRGIAVDSAGNAYVTGYTTSSDFRTVNPVQAIFGAGTCPGVPSGICQDAFVTRLNSTGSALVYSTYLGGSDSDVGTDIAVSPGGGVYVTGVTQSANFPTANPLQVALKVKNAAFVAMIGAAPEFTLSIARLTFGNQVVGTTGPPQTVTLTNNGPGAVNIGSIAITGANKDDFSLVSNSCGGSLGAGTNCTVGVSFTATAEGTRTAAVAITDNTSGSLWTVILTGTGVKPAVMLSATGLSFGDRIVGMTSIAQSVKLTNSGSAPLNITSIAVTGTNSADFAQTSNCGASLPPGGSCTISVTFTATAQGTRSASITVTDNASNSPQTINLTGIGVLPAPTLSLTSLTFGNQIVGTSSPAQSVTLRNNGAAPLSIAAIAITGTNSANFGIVFTNCGTNLAPGADCTISVSFGPIAAGTKTASLTITDNALGSPRAINLTGTALAPAVALSAAGLTFGNQVLRTTSAAQTVKLTNSGSAPLNITSIAVTGTNSADFAQTNTCSVSIGPGANCTITVTFTPTAVGTRTASISITDNAGNSPQMVNLAGTGIVPVLASGGIVNAASFAPNQAMAAGSIASIFGTSLASSTIFANTIPLPTNLGGTSVTVSSSTGSFQAPLFFVSPFQINFQFPWELLGQPEAVLTVSLNGASSNLTTLSMAATGPGIFSLNSQGTGPGAILIANSADLAQPTGGVPGRSSRPVNRGDFISIFCTGLGALTTTPPADGAVTPPGMLFNISVSVTVSIGGVIVAPTFAGLAPGFAGLYQVNVQVPANVTPGNAVSVFLTTDSVKSNTVGIAVQ